MTSFRRSRSGSQPALCACRESMNCRCRRKTKFALSAARSPTTSTRRSSACRFCSGSLRWVWVAATRRRSTTSLSRLLPSRAVCREGRFRPPNGSQVVRCPAPSRFPTTLDARRLKDWTSMDDPLRRIATARTTSSIFRRSCAGRRTERIASFIPARGNCGSDAATSLPSGVCGVKSLNCLEFPEPSIRPRRQRLARPTEYGRRRSAAPFVPRVRPEQGNTR